MLEAQNGYLKLCSEFEEKQETNPRMSMSQGQVRTEFLLLTENREFSLLTEFARLEVSSLVLVETKFVPTFLYVSSFLIHSLSIDFELLSLNSFDCVCFLLLLLATL